MKYYPAMNKNEVMTVAGKYMELDVIILSKVSQTQEDNY